MPICSYCRSETPTDFLICCLTISCNTCLSKHHCPCPDTLPLQLKHPILKTCRRCNLSCITHKCITCKKFYCKQCKDDIHKGKYLTHEVLEISQLKKVNSDEITCCRHQLKRNIVLQNGNVECIRCADEDGLRKVGILQEYTNKIQPQMLKQLLIQKKQSLEYERGLITQKWNNVEDNIKNVFRKLAMELQERQQVTLEKVKNIKTQQCSIFDGLLMSINVQSNSLDSIRQINLNNKDKILKLKYASIEESFKIIQKKKRVGEYHIGRMEIESLISAIKGLVSIDKIKQQFQSEKKRSDIMQSNRKDRRSQSRQMSRSRVSQVNLQSGIKTRQNSFSKLPVYNSFQRKLTQSVTIAQKSRLKSQVTTIQDPIDDLKKSELPNSDKFKNNFLQMKQNIRKSGAYFNNRNTTRR